MGLEPALLEEHRVALTGHCYRMLGSVVDADDAVQETLLRAWRASGGFEERASLRTWLTRIATNVCLDALSDRERRARPMEEGPAGGIDDPLVERPRTHWLEPVPDAAALPADAGPEELASLRQSIRLAFVAALQSLPPKQRAALILTQVLGWSSAEVAQTLATTVASVNSALQRARATLGARGTVRVAEPLTTEQARLLERFVDAFQRYDIERLVELLREDGTFSMPPYPLWLQGREPVRRWLLGRGAPCRGSRLLATAASGSPAFGQYRLGPDGVHRPWALVVLELEGATIAGWNSFLDTGTLFPRFGLPRELARDAGG